MLPLGELLFSPDVIPSSCRKVLDYDLEIRPLASSDHTRGHFGLLSVLTDSPKLSADAYTNIFNQLKSCRNTYFTIVIVQKSTDQIVGVGTVLLERKFTHGGGIIGHIEDIAVAKSMQGRKLGLRVINTLEEIAKVMGCYKVILDCSKDNIPFYEKCGFKHKEFQMVRYLTQAKL